MTNHPDVSLGDLQGGSNLLRGCFVEEASPDHLAGAHRQTREAVFEVPTSIVGFEIVLIEASDLAWPVGLP